MDSMKVFGIGLNKTGTTSLHEALTVLGYRSLHWGGPEVRQRVERAAEARLPLLEYLPGYDAFSDIWALSKAFDLLDRQYPGSRFILTTRDVDGWVDSRIRHVERNRKAREVGQYTGTFLEIEEDLWRAEYDAHHARVAAYFRGRGDLLVMRVTDGDGYEVLCPFLDKPIPAQPFPARNRK